MHRVLKISEPNPTSPKSNPDLPKKKKGSNMYNSFSFIYVIKNVEHDLRIFIKKHLYAIGDEYFSDQTSLPL